MTDLRSTAGAGALVDAPVPQERVCTRCDGTQWLVAEHEGMGKLRCDVCEMEIGFDLEGEPAEFLLFRGHPGRYTKNVFGTELSVAERRVP